MLFNSSGDFVNSLKCRCQGNWRWSQRVATKALKRRCTISMISTGLNSSWHLVLGKKMCISGEVCVYSVHHHAKYRLVATTGWHTPTPANFLSIEHIPSPGHKITRKFWKKIIFQFVFVLTVHSLNWSNRRRRRKNIGPTVDCSTHTQTHTRRSAHKPIRRKKL